MLIAHILNREGYDLQTHLLKISGRNSLHFLRKFIAVTVYLFYGHGTKNRTEMPFQYLLGFSFEGFNRLTHKLFRSCRYIFYRAAYLDNSNAVC
ncbi:hypothetical protein D3C80_1305960 [compost metagenome]